MAYNKTFWIDGETKLNAENLNHIEEGIESVSNKANSNFEQINKNTNDIQKNAIDIETNKNNIKTNQNFSLFNSDRLNILEAQINADKNTIEYTSDKQLEITCNGANIIDCNAHFKKVEGQTRRYSPNIYKMPNNSYTDTSDRYTVKSETKTGIFTLTTKTFTGTMSMYFDINWMPTVGKHTTIANVTDTQFNLEMRKVEDGNSDWLAVTPHDIVVVDTTKHNAIRLYIQFNDDSANQNKTFILKPMVLEGEYTYDELPPFQPYDNTLVSSKATFVSTGRNLLDSNKVTVYNGSIVNGIITILKSENTNVSLKNNVLPAGKYLFEKYYIGSKPSKFYGRIYIQGVEHYFDSDTYQVDIKQPSTISFFFSNQNSTADAVFRLAIYRTDLTTKEYEPYKESKSVLNQELGAYDYIENGQLIKQTSEIITINADNITSIEDTANNTGVYPIHTNIKISNFYDKWEAEIGVSNSDLKVINEDRLWIKQNSIGSNFGDNVVIALGSTKPTLGEVRAKCPIQFVYKKATPTITHIVVPNGIVSYKNGLTSQEIKGKYLPYKYTAKYVNGGQQ